MQSYKDDPRDDKIDLGVGVYKNPQGVTPIMRAVKAAERRWWDEETTKAYTGLAGDPAFSDAMIGLVLGDAVARDHVAAVATPGGTGAVRQAFDLIHMANPQARVFRVGPDMAQPPQHPQASGDRNRQLPLFRQRNRRRRFRWHDGRSRRASRGRRGAFAWLLPQSRPAPT